MSTVEHGKSMNRNGGSWWAGHPLSWILAIHNCPYSISNTVNSVACRSEQTTEADAQEHLVISKQQNIVSSIAVASYNA